ncbi:MAG: hypothetical protein CVV11_01695 [Gammaproteobacteria bacterium HGW-Gammaproteobacteria-15]|nr:MAG: hypothetical protein CVV11_01695 [Gammaproteobacteria bacterium HGW-Gammaproteobacteria-15]
MADINAPTEVLSIKAPMGEVLEVANAHFKLQGFEVTGYDIILMTSEDTWIVSYQPFDHPRGQRGSADKRSYTVEVDKITNKVINAYYAR